MNRAELIEELSARYEGNKRAAGHALDSVLDTITRTVAKGEKVALSGFGVFERAQRAARTARNPATGEPVKVRATAVPRFKPSQALKEVVSGARKLPRLVIQPPPAGRPAEPSGARAAESARPAARAPARKAAGKKAVGKKAAKKAPSRSAAAKKAPARKGAAKKTTAKKTTGRKTAAKKTTGRKTAAKKTTTGKKTTGKKTTGRKTAAKKTTARKSSAKKTTSARTTKRPAKKTVRRR